MEKIISEEEKIRRAEAIAARRQNNRIPASNINSNEKKIKLTLFDKFFLQVISSICIFGLVYFISQNNSYAMDKLKYVMSNDTDFVKVYNDINNLTQNLLKPNEQQQNTIDSGNLENNVQSDSGDEANNSSDNENKEKDSNENESNQQEVDNKEKNKENNLNQEGNEIGETDTNNNQEIANGVGGGNEGTEESTNLDDISYIKSKVSFIKPVTGVITSGYGERTPTDIISANHAGVDIGVNTGTDIVCSMEGKVELVSDYGDYGNHVKITNGDISTLYAHCSKIIVKVGDYIKQGQKIAEAGSTGKATGPHLHFEIRRNNITVDPQKVLDL